MNDPRFRDRPARRLRRRTANACRRCSRTPASFSRRDAEFAIRAGRLRVNGRRVTELPCLVDPARDLIELDGEVVNLRGHAAARSRASGSTSCSTSRKA